MRAALKGKDAKATATQIALRGVQGWLSDAGVDLTRKVNDREIVPSFKNVFQSPELRKLTYKMLKAQRDYTLGAKMEKEVGVPLTKADVGSEKMPFYTTPTGQNINPYGQLIDDGKGGKKFVAWPASEVRRRLVKEQAAMNKYFPKGAALKDIPEDFWNDPEVAPWTKASLKAIFDSIKSQGQLEGWYHRLNKENSSSSSGSWAADVRRSLGNVQVSLQSGFPLAVERTKNGNLIVRWASMEAARQKAADWANRTGDASLDAWGGDNKAFFTDSQRYLQNHAEGQPGESNGIGQQKRDILNAFWFGDNKEFQARNPIREKLRGSDRAGVMRSLRADRMETMKPVEGQFAPPDWEKGKQNFSPATGDEKLKPEDLTPALNWTTRFSPVATPRGGL